MTSRNNSGIHVPLFQGRQSAPVSRNVYESLLSLDDGKVQGSNDSRNDDEENNEYGQPALIFENEPHSSEKLPSSDFIEEKYELLQEFQLPANDKNRRMRLNEKWEAVLQVKRQKSKFSVEQHLKAVTSFNSGFPKRKLTKAQLQQLSAKCQKLCCDLKSDIIRERSSFISQLQKAGVLYQLKFILENCRRLPEIMPAICALICVKAAMLRSESVRNKLITFEIHHELTKLLITQPRVQVQILVYDCLAFLASSSAGAIQLLPFLLESHHSNKVNNNKVPTESTVNSDVGVVGFMVWHLVNKPNPMDIHNLGLKLSITSAFHNLLINCVTLDKRIFILESLREVGYDSDLFANCLNDVDVAEDDTEAMSKLNRLRELISKTKSLHVDLQDIADKVHVEQARNEVLLDQISHMEHRILHRVLQVENKSHGEGDIQKLTGNDPEKRLVSIPVNTLQLVRDAVRNLRKQTNHLSVPSETEARRYVCKLLDLNVEGLYMTNGHAGKSYSGMNRERSEVGNGPRSRTPKSARRPRLNRRQTNQSSALAEFDAKLVYERVMKGILDHLPTMNSRVVRIFLSSTFSDMGTERNFLMQHVNPKLKKFCRDHFGLEFQTIDMRWGVGDDVQLDHLGPSMCYQEITNCLSMSAGPFFISLLGQRYGNRPPAAIVTVATFEKIVQALKEAGRDMALLNEWYVLDENSKPPIYLLKPICSPAEAADTEKLNAAKSRWQAAYSELTDLMIQGASICNQKGELSNEILKHFTASVTEMEVIQGVLQQPKIKLQQALAFVREFPDLPQLPDLSKGRINRFIDVADGKGENGETKKVVNEAIYSMVKDLNHRVLSKLNKSNAFEYNLTWQNDSGVTMDTHGDYVKKFGQDYLNSVEKLVTESVRESMRLRSDDLYSEVLQHSTACVNYVKKFQGRQEIIDKIKAYVQSDQNDPLVVHGDSGSGKTSLLGKAASMVRDWLPESESEQSILLLRFLGTSPGTSSIRQTLKYLCRQLAIFGSEEEQEKCASLDDFKEILNTFYSSLERMGQFRRIIVFLDSVDQLDSSDGAYHLTWVRSPLPENVKMIVSTLPNMYDLLKTFKGKLTNPANYVEVTPLETSLCASILSALLVEQGRTLNSQQWKLVEAAFQHCALPIYVHLLYHQVLPWRSYHQVDESSLRYSVREAIFHLFENLELKHGKIFTSHALAFITASRNGLSETELEDVLSLDDAVLSDVFQHHLPPFVRIPPICWARLRNDIGSYLVEREADNIRVVYWYHRQFIEVAQEYFLSNEQLRKSAHSLLADYFLGLWSRKKKKFVYPAYIRKKMNLPEFSMEDRSVPEQPFILRTDEDGTVQYNLRKLNELPWHLVKADRIEEFYDYIVFDYEFLFQKLSGTSRYLLLRDLDLPQKLNLSFIKEAELVYNAIRLSAQSLVYDPINLSVDLIGRLIVYENECPRVKLLLDQCRKSEHALANNCLIPQVQCFDSGSGVLYSSFDLGLGMGIVMPNGLFVVFSLVSNDITWFDIEGNEIKRFSTDYNLFLSMKYLSHANIPDDCVVYVASIRAKGVDHMDMEGMYLTTMRQKLQNEVEEYEASGQEVPKGLAENLEMINAGQIPPEMMEELEKHKKELGQEEEEGTRNHDLVKVDFLNGRATKVLSFKPEWGITSDDIENVTKDIVLMCKGKSDSTGLCQLSILSLAEEKKLPLTESGADSVSSRIGSQYFDSASNFICFSNKQDSGSTLICMDLNTNEKKELSLLDEIRSLKDEGIREILTVSDHAVAMAKSDETDQKEDDASENESPEKALFEKAISELLNTTKIEPLSCVIADGKLVMIATVLNAEKGDYAYFLIISCKNLKILQIEATGDILMKAKYSQNFVSKSKKKVIFLLKTNPTAGHGRRGFIFDTDLRKSVPLTVGQEHQSYNKAIKNFGDGTQAKFTEDEKLALTSGVKVLLLVWSVKTGQLLRGIAYGSAESFLGGQPRGTDFFTICHFPDESAPGDEERMYIMTKVYNLKYFYDDLEQEEHTMLPNFTQDKGSYCSVSGNDSSVVRIRSKDCISLSLDTMQVTKFPPGLGDQDGENFTVIDVLSESPRVELMQASNSILSCELVMHDPEMRRQFSDESEKLEEAFHNIELKETTDKLPAFVFNNFELSRPMQTPLTNFLPLNESLTWLDRNRQLLVRFKVSSSYHGLTMIISLVNFITGKGFHKTLSNNDYQYSKSKLGSDVSAIKEAISQSIFETFNDTICKGVAKKSKKSKKKKAKKRDPESDDEEEEKEVDIEKLTEEEKDQKLKQFADIAITSKQELVQIHPMPAEAKFAYALAMKHKTSECIRTGAGVTPPIWLGRVLVVDYSGSDAAEPNDFKVTEGKLFDMGPAVAFLSDNKHLVNYKLQIVEFETGIVQRSLRPEEEIYFVRLQLTPDSCFIAGQVCFPAYEVEFTVFDDDSSMESDMFAIQPPRGIQVYRMSDGSRFANYLFESDPMGFCLAGSEGRDMIVLTHNCPVMVFSLKDPPADKVQINGGDAVGDESGEETLAEAKLQITVRHAPGPKPEYLEQLAPALTKAMAEVVNARPADPIRFLAESLMRLQITEAD